MAAKQETEVLVVGGGPIGLFTGLVLARKGIRVKVIDEQWKPATRSYALALHPASLRIFADLDLSTALLEKGNSVETVGLYGGGRLREKIEISRLAGRFPFILVLPQHVLESVLQTAFEGAGGTMLWSHRLADFSQSAGGVSTTVERLEKESTGYSVTRTEWVVDKTLEFHSAFLIGADGHRSRIRRKLGIEFAPSGESNTFAVFEFATAASSGTELQVVLEDDSMSVLWPLPGGRFRWSFELVGFAESVDPRTKSRLFVQFRDEAFPHVSEEKMFGLIAERAPWFETKIVETVWSAAVRFERRLADRFGEGRTWLVGDAAHLALPIGIQSMNMGFREALDLAERIARVLRGSASARGARSDLELQGIVERADYESHWRAEWLKLLSLADSPPLKPGASPWIRTRAARIPPCIPASGEDLTALLEQVGIGA